MNYGKGGEKMNETSLVQIVQVASMLVTVGMLTDRPTKHE